MICPLGSALGDPWIKDPESITTMQSTSEKEESSLVGYFFFFFAPFFGVNTFLNLLSGLEFPPE